MLRAGLTKRKEQGPLPADTLRIVIRNCGRRVESGHAENGNEIGIGNTEERLKTLDGTDFEFSLAWLETNTCEVVVELPLRWAPILQEAPPCVL
jgi:two-component system, LytTR family, sensor kinase